MSLRPHNSYIFREASLTGPLLGPTPPCNSLPLLPSMSSSEFGDYLVNICLPHQKVSSVRTGTGSVLISRPQLAHCRYSFKYVVSAKRRVDPSVNLSTLPSSPQIHRLSFGNRQGTWTPAISLLGSCGWRTQGRVSRPTADADLAWLGKAKVAWGEVTHPELW